MTNGDMVMIWYDLRSFSHSWAKHQVRQHVEAIGFWPFYFVWAAATGGAPDFDWFWNGFMSFIILEQSWSLVFSLTSKVFLIFLEGAQFMDTFRILGLSWMINWRTSWPGTLGIPRVLWMVLWCVCKSPLHGFPLWSLCYPRVPSPLHPPLSERIRGKIK